MSIFSSSYDLGDGGLEFGYRVAYLERQGALLIKVFLGGECLTRFERFGISALRLHLPDSLEGALMPAHRRFAQNLLRFAHLNTSDEFFIVPKKHIGFFIPKLVRFKKIVSFKTGRPLNFPEELLTPVVHLSEETSSQIKLALSLKSESSGQRFLITSTHVFSGRKAWAFCEDSIYEVKESPLNFLYDKFNSEGILILKGTRAADFIEEDLATLMKRAEVHAPPGFDKIKIKRPKPKVVNKITEELTGDRLILEINFSYEGHLVPPHVDASDVLYKLGHLDPPILIHRDLEFEEEILQKYYQEGFRRLSVSKFATGGDQALDFLSETLPQLKEDVDIEGEEGLQHFKLFGSLGKKQIRARALATGTDWLELELNFDVEGTDISYQMVQSLLSQGKKYVNLPGKGFIKLDIDELNDFSEKISELQAKVDKDGKLKISQFHAAYLDELLNINWGEQSPFGQMVRSLRDTGGIPRKALPETLVPILRDYQHYGYDWLHFLNQHRLHGILADDMGLGKTLQALSFLKSCKDEQGSAPSLVIAPTSVVFNWAAEAEKFTPDLKVLVLSGPNRKDLFQSISDSDLVLTSYALFRRDIEVHTQYTWRSAILDEAQNIKNYRSKTATLVKKLKAEQRWALTGTPLENRLSEFWSIFDFLMPGFLGHFTHFKRKYQQPIEVEQNPKPLENLKRRIYPFVLRRLKNDVAKELPPKTEIINYCEMTPEQAKLYQNVLLACRKQVFSEVEKKGIERSHVSILTALLRLRQVCCHPKLLKDSFNHEGISSGKMQDFQDLIKEVMSEGHRLLVFSQFVEMLQLLRHWLEEEGIAYEYLDGRTKKREQKIKHFNSDPNVPVFLVSLRAGGTGLNLTGASYVIHYDPWWNPAVQDQATDRAHRIGQDKHVFSYKLITKNSVEEKILKLQEKKKNLANQLLSVDSAMGKVLNFEDLEYLFS